MKVVLCNKYFFLNGGTEKYLQELMRRLTTLGHEAIPFSVGYADSWPSPYSRFFLPPPGPPEQIYYRSVRLSARNWLRYVDRATYSVEARLRVARLLDAVGGADIAYLLNIYNYMSPSVVHSFRRRGVPVVMRLGDYNLQCPSYLFLRRGRPCTLCLDGSLLNGLRHRCVKGSLAASALRVGAMYLHRLLRLYEQVSAFVVPCRFMREMLAKGGFPAERIHVLRSPAVADAPPQAAGERRHILYFGRLTAEKGLDTLLDAYQELDDPPELLLAGRSYDGEQQRLERLVRPDFRGKVRFLGFQGGAALSALIAEALFTVAPSRWYDNAPLSVYESFLQGTPVVAARIGGIPEQVEDGVTGRLFPPEDVRELRAALAWMLADRGRLTALGTAARAFVERECSLDGHATLLLGLFERIRAHG